MIQIRSENGDWIRSLPSYQGETIEYHKLYGFVTTETREERARRRTRHGLRAPAVEPEFSFNVNLVSNGFELSGAQSCSVSRAQEGWTVVAPRGKFTLSLVPDDGEFVPVMGSRRQDEAIRFWNALPLVAAVLLIAFAMFNAKVEIPVETQEPPKVEPVVVQMENRTVVPVEKPKPEPQQEQKNQALDKTAKVKKALTQNLGFLKLMGRKDLKKAMGGLPTDVPEASPGAGPGGKEGSGGQLLVGLGKGLRRTTVGNSGLEGLGGIGTKGAGGGLGGYGETDIGSGGGRNLSTIPLSQDAVIEGGLDRSLIQATILRYLSQVRACYEEGLKKRGDLIGQVTMNFEISGSGGVNFSRVQRSSLGDKNVEDCISKRMMFWKFPAPKGGVNVRVSYPFMLRPVKG